MTIDRTRSSIAFRRSQNFRYVILVIISCEVVEIRGCISALGKKTTVWLYPLPQRYDGDKMVLWHGMWRHRASSCHFRWMSLDGHRFSIIYFIGWFQMRSAQPILSGHIFLSLKFLAREKNVAPVTDTCRSCHATTVSITPPSYNGRGTIESVAPPSYS